MNHCEYWDAGWCYSPKGVKNNASSSGACLEPKNCPHLITKECRQTGKTRTTTKNLLEKAYYEQMTKEETLEYEIKEYTLEIEQKAKEIGKLKDILDRKEQELKQMKEIDISTVLIEGDTATIMGVKYQRIIEPQSFYDKIYGLLDDNLIEWVDTNNITIRVLDLIRENIPEPYKGVGLLEYSVGYNEGIRKIEENLK